MWSDTFRNNHVEIVIQTINLLITAEGKTLTSSQNGEKSFTVEFHVEIFSDQTMVLTQERCCHQAMSSSLSSVCMLSQQVNYYHLPFMHMYTHMHTLQVHTLFINVCMVLFLVFFVVFFLRFWTATGWCYRRWRKLQKPNTHQVKVHTPKYTHTHMHIPVLFPLLTAFLCQNTCLIWSSTLTRWRSCRSTVTQTERRRLAPPSAAWRTFPKSSSLPWKTWWVMATKHLQLMSFYLKICNFSLKKNP